MRNRLKLSHFFLLIILSGLTAGYAQDSSWIRVNRLGYLPESIKTAVFISQQKHPNANFSVKEAKTDAVALTGSGVPANAARWGLQQAIRLDISALTKPGGYYIECNGIRSPYFTVGANVYDRSADYLLNYMRQQRCGFNPYLDTLCHQHDGFIVDHPTRTGEKIDVRGGWHDASDYLQYLTTSANATFQMMFAWQQTPDKTIFRDAHDAAGKKGANGIPDILDEIRWGLEWMLRMNPDSAVMFNQIADDRDHAGMRLPSRDPVDYGWGAGTGRPVYFITGQPQGLTTHKNRTTGVASSAAKFASAFSLGAELFKTSDPAFAAVLKSKAVPAFRFAEANPGNTQTACVISPYFYEEDNYVDDMELAAAVQYEVTGDNQWKKTADHWGRLEEITPWMELGRARHYQFYPFVNLGHFYLSKSDDQIISEKYTEFMRRGLECLLKRAKENDDPFLNGIPFIWCSNNLVAAAITQARLYHQTSNDTTFLEMEAALRDWLFGCNPWGTSMICGYPENVDYPSDAHSVFVKLHTIPYGGLIDGPIYKSIFDSLRGVELTKPDVYAAFQHGVAVYHDDIGDYSSNEPTMDGTASLSFYLSTMEKTGKSQQSQLPQTVIDSQGAVVRKNADSKTIHLVFSADMAFEGASHILDVLKKQNIKASFFLTGNCLRMKEHENIIKRIIREKHYVGPHSDKHLLYASWDVRSQSLVTPDSLINDLRQNLYELQRMGINPAEVVDYLPPYEYYNIENVKTIESLGLKAVNFTPGVTTSADYKTPDMKNYLSSQQLMEQLYAFEAKEGLNGAIILIHPGTVEARTDKLYLRLDEMIEYLKKKGYTFEKL
ncbi:MAG: glycoside hydrolase family 9 protein [Dysgonamonadaceae bacterium]|jgi:peptidoglycan/xylan/chitin deacetylase (PgdA/CDA1 family)|nr:glycoside hydrolase family 9 protein [Dysgonamonadaceae bacterium]